MPFSPPLPQISSGYPNNQGSGSFQMDPDDDLDAQDGTDAEDASHSPVEKAPKKGRKSTGAAATANAQARRDQNRIAQREFRQRKQQEIKDLQAKVELLSGDRDERQEALALLVRNLLSENAQLRKFVKELSAFIGEGLATCLPRMGMSLDSLEDFLNRPETAPAHEAMESLRASRNQDESSGSKGPREISFDEVLGTRRGESSTSAQNRAPAKDISHMDEMDRRKRPRTDMPNSGPSVSRPVSPSRAATYPMDSRLHDNGNRQPISREREYIPPQPFPYPTPSYNAPVFTNEGVPQYYQNPSSSGMDPSFLPVEEPLNDVRNTNILNSTFEIADTRHQEAIQLIGYHLNNYRANPLYILPPSLKPTVVQQSIPHEHLIDGMIFPTLRDKLILLRGRYDIIPVFNDIFKHFHVRGEDALDHRCWDVDEVWLRANAWFWDTEVLEITNKWRVKRGEPILTKESLVRGQ